MDADLATLRDWIGDPEDYSDEDRGAAERACDACDGVEAELSRLRMELDETGECRMLCTPEAQAELSRLREQRDAAQRESDIQMGEKLAAQMTLKAITDSLCLPLAKLGEGWADATGKIIARIEEIVDEGERGFRERDAAEARCARLQQALAGLESAVRILDVMLREPAAEGLMSAEDYRSYVQGAWLGVDEAAEKARDALAGPDAQTSGSGSSAADPSAGERQGRQPDPGEIAGLLVELSRWSRVAELNGDLHARIASALAGQPTAAEGPDTPADSQEDKT